jgi:hypothetical protein
MSSQQHCEKSDEVVWGIRAIAKEINLDKRAAAHFLRKGLPAPNVRVAEGVRFELTRPLRACQFSRLVP